MENTSTIIDDMVVDLIVDQENETVTILHDQPFDDVLVSLEYDEKHGTLLFKFENKEQLFGLELLGDYADYLYENKTITLLQIDTDTDKAVAGLEVPLTFVEDK